MVIIDLLTLLLKRCYGIITIKPGKHTIIPLKTPQGKLKIMINTKENYQFIVRKTNQKETINVQTINSTQKYITGNYDIELLTLPRHFFSSSIRKLSLATLNPLAP